MTSLRKDGLLIPYLSLSSVMQVIEDSGLNTPECVSEALVKSQHWRHQLSWQSWLGRFLVCGHFQLPSCQSSLGFLLGSRVFSLRQTFRFAWFLFCSPCSQTVATHQSHCHERASRACRCAAEAASLTKKMFKASADAGVRPKG